MPVNTFCRDLGILIQSDLKPSAHIHEIVSKAQKRINYLRQVNEVNGGDNVFVPSMCVCLSVFLCFRVCAADRSIRPVYKKAQLTLR